RADRSVGETYSAVRPQLAAATVAGILAAIGIGIGLILLIVPGLYLLTIWSMLIPVIVIERRSAGEAFTRSREVVRGNGRSVCGPLRSAIRRPGVVRTPLASRPSSHRMARFA